MALRNIGALTLKPSALRVARFGSRVNKDAAMAAIPRTQAVTAAPMYSHTASRSCGGGIRPCTLLFDAERGVNEAGVFPESGITLSVKNGRAYVRGGASAEPGATVAVQLYPTILRNGVVQGSSTPESSVAGIGVLRDGNLLVLVAGGGSPRELGEEFKRRGAVHAGYTDAGSSAALWVEGEGWRGAHAANPMLPGWLAVAPPMLSPIKTGLIVGGVLLTLASLGLLAGWYFKGTPDAIGPKTFNARARRRHRRR